MTVAWQRIWVVTLAALFTATSVLATAPAGAEGTGSITIVENAIPNDARDFSFTGCLGSGCSTFGLDDDAGDATLPSQVSATNLAAATYTVTQAPDTSWTLTGLTCDTGETVDLAARRATIDLGAGEDVTCTFTNRTQRLTIIQDTVPDTAQDFAFSGCQGAGCGSFTLDDDADATRARSASSTGLGTGTYQVTQAATAGYDLTGLSCTTPEQVDLGARRVTVTLDVGESVTCTFTAQPTPSPLFGITQIATGAAHTCALLTNTQVRCWGDDDRYQLGNGGGRASTPWPQTVLNETGTGPLTGVVELAPGWLSTCARLESGEARCWGSAYYGLLGNGQGAPNSAALPVAVLNPTGTGPLTGIDQLSVSTTHACARVDDQAYCWGIDTYGQLGHGGQTSGAHTERWLPASVLNEAGTGPLGGIVDIETFGIGGSDQGRTCARLSSGQARCWGNNLNGALGDGTTTGRSLPVVVRNAAGTGPMIDVQELALGGFHTCARFTNGYAGCWGYGANGQLGRGPAGNVEPPAVVLTSDGSGPLTGVTALSAAAATTCARRSSGTVLCWGDGPLGDGTGDDHPLPVTVQNVAGTAPLTDVAAIDTRNAQRCVLLSFGQARCWGANTSGQLGHPRTTATSSLLPVAVNREQPT